MNKKIWDVCQPQCLKTCNHLKSESRDNQSKGHRRNANLAQEIAFDCRDAHCVAKQRYGTNISPRLEFPNYSDDIDDARAAISVPQVDVPTMRMGTARGFLRFGGNGARG